MTPTETATILRQFNEWRLGDEDLPQPDPHEIDKAIDAAIEMIDRLEAAEKDIALKERVIDSLGSELNAVANERDALRARIREMEQQKPVAWLYEAEYSSGSYSDNYFEWRITRNKSDLYGARKIKPLYKTPRPQNTPEKLCYDSRWEVSLDYVDGWNAAVDMMRGKSPSWHCPDCCIAFPFGAPKVCPHDDARCNKLLADAKESA